MNRLKFRLALGAGLGRCLLQLRAHRATPSQRRSVLLACVRNVAYDPQCEGSRHQYLLDLASATHSYEAIEATVLARFRQSVGTWDFDTMSIWIEEFAAHGNQRARDQVYDLVERVDTFPDGFRDQAFVRLLRMLVRLDAKDGFVRGARRLQRIADAVDPWVVTAFLETSREFFGAANESELVAKLPLEVRAFLDRRSEELKAARAAPAPRPTLADGWEGFVEQWRAMQTTRSRWGHAWARGWAKEASRAELQRAAEDLRDDGDEDLVLLALNALQRMPWPGSARDLMRLTASDHPRTSRLSISALAKLPADPEIRGLAWMRLTTGGTPDFARLLANNLVAGDGARLAAVLPTLMSGNADDRHVAAVASLDGFAECKMPDESFPIWAWIYEQSPCSQCRLHAVEHLVSDATMPSGWVDECRWDSSAEIRACVARGQP